MSQPPQTGTQRPGMMKSSRIPLFFPHSSVPPLNSPSQAPHLKLGNRSGNLPQAGHWGPSSIISHDQRRLSRGANGKQQTAGMGWGGIDVGEMTQGGLGGFSAGPGRGLCASGAQAYGQWEGRGGWRDCERKDSEGSQRRCRGESGGRGLKGSSPASAE